MSNSIQFHISQADGIYTADGINVPIVTEAKTFEELQDNIREAVALYLEGENPVSLGFGDLPSIHTNFELPAHLHGVEA